LAQVASGTHHADISTCHTMHSAGPPDSRLNNTGPRDPIHLLRQVAAISATSDPPDSEVLKLLFTASFLDRQDTWSNLAVTFNERLDTWLVTGHFFAADFSTFKTASVLPLYSDQTVSLKRHGEHLRSIETEVLLYSLVASDSECLLYQLASPTLWARRGKHCHHEQPSSATS